MRAAKMLPHRSIARQERPPPHRARRAKLGRVRLEACARWKGPRFPVYSVSVDKFGTEL